jgi:hypothetical protein
VKINFPYTTRWVQIFNTDATAADSMRVGLTENGVNGVEGASYIILAGGQSTDRLELKCTSLWFKQQGGAASFSVIAGLTNVPADDFPVITGSNGFAGVG